jgi:uncharacterized protein
MKNIYRVQCIFMFSILTLPILSGCASTESSRFYTLNAIKNPADVQRVAASEQRITVGIGPIEIPDYLDRPQIVTRNSDNELKIDEYGRWGGSLKEDINRVLAENLSVLLSQKRVAVVSSLSGVSFDYRVIIDIGRFDIMPDGNVALKAQWSIIERNGRTVVVTRESGFTVEAKDKGYGGQVSAMSGALEMLSKDIADSIKSIDRRIKK